MCRVLFLSYHYLSLPVEGVRSVVYVVFFSVCVTRLIFGEDKIIVVDDRCCCACV